MRAAGSDEALRLTPPVILSLEQCLEFIEDDELVEVTPKNIRLRKKILDTELRAKTRQEKKNSLDLYGNGIKEYTIKGLRYRI